METVVYYAHGTVMDVPCVVVTSKAYWNANHFVDDGSGPDYEAIADAMEACGAPPTAKSVHELPDGGLDALVAAMGARGFKLRPDKAFGAYVARI